MATSTCRFVSERRGRGIVEPHLDLDDARVLARGRVGADLVLLAHLLADALDHAAELAAERAAGDRGRLADLHPADVGLIHFGDRVHAVDPAELDDACGPICSPGRACTSRMRPATGARM